MITLEKHLPRCVRNRTSASPTFHLGSWLLILDSCLSLVPHSSLNYKFASPNLYPGSWVLILVFR